MFLFVAEKAAVPVGDDGEVGVGYGVDVVVDGVKCDVNEGVSEVCAVGAFKAGAAEAVAVNDGAVGAECDGQFGFSFDADGGSAGRGQAGFGAVESEFEAVSEHAEVGFAVGVRDEEVGWVLDAGGGEFGDGAVVEFGDGALVVDTVNGSAVNDEPDGVFVNGDCAVVAAVDAGLTVDAGEDVHAFFDEGCEVVFVAELCPAVVGASGDAVLAFDGKQVACGADGKGLSEDDFAFELAVVAVRMDVSFVCVEDEGVAAFDFVAVGAEAFLFGLDGVARGAEFGVAVKFFGEADGVVLAGGAVRAVGPAAADRDGAECAVEFGAGHTEVGDVGFGKPALFDEADELGHDVFGGVAEAQDVVERGGFDLFFDGFGNGNPVSGAFDGWHEEVGVRAVVSEDAGAFEVVVGEDVGTEVFLECSEGVLESFVFGVKCEDLSGFECSFVGEEVGEGE